MSHGNALAACADPAIPNVAGLIGRDAEEVNLSAAFQLRCGVAEFARTFT
jgi:hypothetical protein